MRKWLIGKLQSNRIANWNVQLALELKKLPASEVALVVVKAIDFCLSFRQHENGFLISKAIEEPSKHLADDGARELYGKLEDILLAAQQELKPTLERAKESLPPAAHANVAKSIALNHVSLRLLMSRVSHVFKSADPRYIGEVSACLRAALSSIDEAAAAFEAEQRATGTTKDGSYYKFVRDAAYNYAASYPM
ncbi:MAG: hypothetical protein ACRD2L_12580 [Terriglobia bacterium]